MRPAPARQGPSQSLAPGPWLPYHRPAVAAVSPEGAASKRTAVRVMFGRIAGRYDRVNRIMSGGLDGGWRRAAAREAALPPGGLALDLGTGTGDLALALARSAPGVRVVGVDYTWPMLRLAPAKAATSGLALRTAWAAADAGCLPFPDATFDSVASAFVLRNLADLRSAAAEMARVTRPGGRVVALEIAPDSAPMWRPVFRAYFHHVVPALGRLLGGDRQAYTYLPASVAAFLDGAAVADALAAAGLRPLAARRLMMGSVAIHRGLKE
jgi:demethylmenaquinone methyltransferase/2-methoxy-6-polyprenyl-1,4-benzoquinol methylase